MRPLAMALLLWGLTGVRCQATAPFSAAEQGLSPPASARSEAPSSSGMAIFAAPVGCTDCCVKTADAAAVCGPCNLIQPLPQCARHALHRAAPSRAGTLFAQAVRLQI